ncbi:MAG: hypothetical protein V4489_10355 [Chlamydiota bacterium]
MIKILLPLTLILCPCFAEKHARDLPVGALLHLEINMNGGERLFLNDNSVWDVNPEDLEISRLWLSPFPMKITLGGSDLYPYLIINVRSQEKIKVKPSDYLNEQDP